jgi:hypothetical protein
MGRIRSISLLWSSSAFSAPSRQSPRRGASPRLAPRCYGGPNQRWEDLAGARVSTQLSLRDEERWGARVFLWRRWCFIDHRGGDVNLGARRAMGGHHWAASSIGRLKKTPCPVGPTGQTPCRNGMACRARCWAGLVGQLGFGKLSTFFCLILFLFYSIFDFEFEFGF